MFRCAAEADAINFCLSLLFYPVGPAALMRTPQMAHSLRCCNIAAQSSPAVRSRKPQRQIAPLRAFNVRADASVNAVAVDQPPNTTSSSSKEKVKIGINGKEGSTLASRRTMLRTCPQYMLCRFRQDRSLGHKSSHGKRRH